MSLLYHLDPDFIFSSNYNSIIDAWKGLFPSYGKCGTKEQAEKVMGDLRYYYSPIYDYHGWKLKYDKDGERIGEGNVTEEWWEVLEGMLVREASPSE